MGRHNSLFSFVALVVGLLPGCGGAPSNPPPPQKAVDPAMIQDKMKESMEKSFQYLPPQQKQAMEKVAKGGLPGIQAEPGSGSTPKAAEPAPKS
jgi:hypothetical protein